MNKLTEFIHAHADDDVNDLLLHADHYPDIDIQEAASQIRGLQTARHKLPLWARTEGIRFPVRLSMEQCSSQITAEYKATVARRLVGEATTNSIHIADLTGGFGVDATLMARAFPDSRLIFIERDQSLCELATHNLPLLGVKKAEVVCGDCTELINKLPHQQLVFIDPARRDILGRKMVAIDDCQPDLLQLNDLLLEKTDHLIIKLSPMLDIHDACCKLKGVREAHVVSVDGECKELLLVLSKVGDDNLRYHCVNIRKDRTEQFTTTESEANATTCIYTSSVDRYLYEPNASIMKAALFGPLAQRFGLKKLHPNSHLFTSDSAVGDFPGRQFEVTGCYGFSKHDIKALRQELSQANITVRNFPETPEALAKRLKIRQGGDCYIFATTTNDNRHVLIVCKKCK